MPAKRKTEGTVSVISEVKFAKTAIESEQTFGVTGIVAEVSDQQCRVEWSGGRTISLRPFEFARIDVRIAANGGEDELALLRKGVNAVVAAETSALTSESKQSLPDLSFLDGLSGVLISVNYGMTFSLPNFESYRFDVSIQQARTDGESVNDLFGKIAAITERNCELQIAAINKRRGK
jgi:hypothetical protein